MCAGQPSDLHGEEPAERALLDEHHLAAAALAELAAHLEVAEASRLLLAMVGRARLRKAL
jgi:hypothetical protein